MSKIRPYSMAFCGGAYGDEGKGRIVDKFVSDFAKKRDVIVYRDNGGANAGHTVEFENGKRVALHQLPSGIFHKKATVVLGKGMVIHPGDLLVEILQVKAAGYKLPKIVIDEMATLSLDTHRAFEAVLKDWEEGGKGSTGRGIAPAYVDIVLRHPLRVRDLVPFNREKVAKHYKLYQGLLRGLGRALADVDVPELGSTKLLAVGSLEEFTARLSQQAKTIAPYIKNVYSLLQTKWGDKKTAFIFEKAQAIGLDTRWGVYPDVTASDCTFDGIFSATEGIVSPSDISIRAGVLKATYMSSVGIRKLPTVMEEKLANKIREDAHEYGATTRRPRGIAYLDIPSLQFFSRVGNCNALILTHMDVVYAEHPIKICVAYTKGGKEVSYRPDQEFLHTVKPKYIELPSWDKEKLMKAKTKNDLPKEAKKFLQFIEKSIGLPVHMITTGPKREQGIIF